MPRITEGLYEKKIRSAMRGGRKWPPGCDVVHTAGVTKIVCMERNAASARVLAFLTVFFVGMFVATIMSNPPNASTGHPGSLVFFSVVVLLFAALASWRVLCHLWGRIEIEITSTHASMFYGIGQVGFRRRFEPSDVTKVQVICRTIRSTAEWVQIETASKNIRCGNWLAEPQRIWLTAMLRVALGLPMRP